MKNNFKSFCSKLVAVAVSATLIAGFTPVAGVFADEVSSEAIAIEAPVEEALAEEAAIDPIEEVAAAEALVEEVSADVVVSEIISQDVAVSGNPDQFTEPVLEDPLLKADEDEATVTAASSQFYAQPAWNVNSSKGYDAITAYIADVSGNYIARCFFVCDISGQKDWRLYDYGQSDAEEFFVNTELKDGRYIPTQKAAMRSDNPATVGIDEGKIPVLSQDAYNSLTNDWRSLSDVPFLRNGSDLVYAGKQGGGITPTPTPTPDSSLNLYQVSVNGNTYEIRLTKSVSYNGKRHVRKTAKATKNQSPDLTLEVYRNGQLVDPGYYTVRYYNNLNVNGYGRDGVKPCLTVVPRNVHPFGPDRKILARTGFVFDILPIDISKVNFVSNRIKVKTTANGLRVTMGNATAKVDGQKLKLSPQGSKNPRTGAFVASYSSDGRVTVYGVNNYSGSTSINLLAARSIDCTF